MMITRFEQIEQISGNGPVFGENGENIGSAVYSITVMQQVIDARSMEEPNAERLGLQNIEGHIEGIDTFKYLGSPLTLHLEDGRKLDFSIQNQDGRMAHRGGKGLQQP